MSENTWEAIGAIAGVLALMLSIALEWERIVELYTSSRATSISLVEATKRAITLVAKRAWRPVLAILCILLLGSWTRSNLLVQLLQPLSSWTLLQYAFAIVQVVPLALLVYILLLEPWCRTRHIEETRLRGEENAQAVIKLNQRIAELERHNENLLKTQRSNLHRLNELTQESNELRDRLREQKVFKAIYYDPNYKIGWIENPGAVANFFAERGFEVLNALQLGHWVDERMKYNESCRSLLVFAQDAVPDTVADLRSDTCKLRLFLNNGARVVWHGDVPFWYQAWPESRYEEWRAEGPFLVLRVEIIFFTEFLTDQPLNGTLTEKGRMWGIVLPGPAQRGVPIREVDDVFTLGPSIDETNTACAWRKIYNPHFPHSGFLRYWPGSRDGRDAAINVDYFRFATSGWSAAPDVELPEIEVPIVTIVSGTVGEFSHTPDGPWTPAVACDPVHSAWQSAVTIIKGAKWVWIKERPTDQEAREGQIVWHRVKLQLPQRKSFTATLSLMVDNYVKIVLNGQPVGERITMNEGVVDLNISSYLRPGDNIMEMEIENAPGSAQATYRENPAGIIYGLNIR